ncbi:MAG: pyruvate synthase [Desulfuromonas sp.]|nr:pyruvate synthase [Desulfuromonas sp.]
MVTKYHSASPASLGRGTVTCAGCGGMQAIRQTCRVLGEKTVFVNAAGCMSLLAVYPFTPFHGSWLYTAMASAPAGAQGVRDALDILRDKGEIAPDNDLQVVVLTGDGSAYGMGLSATSGALDRQLDFLYLCYDNEGYGNTGQQTSAATPHAAHTATCRGLEGLAGVKKDLFAIWAAHDPVYLATVIASYPNDLARKIEKAKQLRGPRLIIALAPCPTGWGFDPRYTTTIGKLAVDTGIWPLKEYRDGQVVHTHIPAQRLPVEQYLKRQQRFAHLFEPQRNDVVLGELQAEVDHYWDGVTP